MTFDLSSFADLLEELRLEPSAARSTGDLGSPGDWKLEAIQDGDTAYIKFPLIAEAAARRQDLGQGRREDALERGRRAAEAVRLARRHRPARRLRAPQGRLRLDRGRREREDPRRRDEPLPRDDRHREARAARPGRAAAEPRRPRSDRPAGRADGAPARHLDRRRPAGAQARRSISTRSSPAPTPPVKASLVVELYDYGTPLDLSCRRPTRSSTRRR